MSRLGETGALPSVQAVFELAGLDCSDALVASDRVALLESKGAMTGIAQSFFARCESPIERLFLLGIFENHYALRIDLRASSGAGLWFAHPDPGGLRLLVFNQREYGVARVDFTLTLELNNCDWFAPTTIVVEVDGKEFHDRTAAQATRDRRRDRAIMAHPDGPDAILRFSGSEIVTDLVACVNESLDALTAAAIRYRRKQARERRRKDALDREGET